MLTIYLISNGESQFLMSPLQCSGGMVPGFMKDNDDALCICTRFYYFIYCLVWAQPRMLSSSIFVLWETFRTSHISSHTSQLTGMLQKVYHPAIPSPALQGWGRVGVSHRGSWWGGGSSIHRKLFFKITETLIIPSTYSVLVSITTKPLWWGTYYQVCSDYFFNLF